MTTDPTPIPEVERVRELEAEAERRIAELRKKIREEGLAEDAEQ